ncbi:CLAVATA3/ESR-RELATED 6 [Euphorbia peplus]|nr:CLAVATA3/ESR-RELATED 6 [Euphorbia peplus]
MASSSVFRVLILLIVLILSVNVSNSEGKSFRGVKGIDTRALLKGLRYDLRKVKHVIKDVDPSRVSPGGPDPQHHV